MSLVKLKDKRSGVTYVYESESYWDKEKKQPRNRRKLIGKLDETTGEIVPTGKSGRKKSAETTPETTAEPITKHLEVIAEKDEQIQQLKAQIRQLKRDKQDLIRILEDAVRKYTE